MQMNDTLYNTIFYAIPGMAKKSIY
jgi:hypothetical protein